MRPFTLLQRSLTLRRPPAAGSTLLAYIFEIVLGPRLTRSASHSRPRPAFFRPAGLDRCELPVANFIVPELSVCPQAATPLQDLSILRDPSTQLVSTRKSLPLRVARSAFAPRDVAIMNYHVRHVSQLQLRYFPLGSLSFEPLGTKDIMRSRGAGVK